MAQNLLQLLKEAAASETCNGLTIHQPNTEDTAVLKITYTQLYEQANRRAKRLEATTSLSKNPIILLHVEDHFDAIPWFWAIIAAGAVPCMSTQFSRDPEQRQRHIRSLQKLLHRPLIVTTEALLANFPCKDEFLILTTSAIDNISSLDIDSVAESARDNLPGLSKQPEELALLLLTSGSTGESKAVSLTHFQILAAVDGKIKLHGTSSRDTFLAWTSFDHAANLVEIHLHSLRLEANQIHISPLSVIEDPLEFLYKLSTYHVSYTFAPNFLLAKICSCLDFRAAPGDLLPIDLNHLRALISGGESNTTGTAVKLTTLLQRYNAPKSFIRPGLGLRKHVQVRSTASIVHRMTSCKVWITAQWDARQMPSRSALCIRTGLKQRLAKSVYFNFLDLAFSRNTSTAPRRQQAVSHMMVGSKQETLHGLTRMGSFS